MEPKVYQSNTIINNQQEMIAELDEALLIHRDMFGGGTPTWTYKGYNTFGLTSPSKHFYNLFVELRDIIKENVDSPQIWMQSWINYHDSEKILGWHKHDWPIHGYISIRPHKSRTQFRDYEVINEVGNIYLGEGRREHRVVIDEPFDTPRITLGFDVLYDIPNSEVYDNIGLIPI